MIHVSRNDVLGTAMTAAKIGASRLEGARARVAWHPLVHEAMEDLIQALAEASYIAAGVGSVGSDLRDLESDGVQFSCDYIAEKIRTALRTP